MGHGAERRNQIPTALSRSFKVGCRDIHFPIAQLLRWAFGDTGFKMPASNVRHKSSKVVLFVDLLNHFEFPDGTELLKNALRIADNLARLKRRARNAKVPLIYVNDNFGQWRSDAKETLRYCMRDEAPGREFVRKIAPDEQDYFVLKPMNSAFYQTPLDALLRYFGARSIVVAGISTNSCILCTAHDARMRDLEALVASDCCAARSKKEHEQALDHMKETAGARILQSSSIRF